MKISDIINRKKEDAIPTTASNPEVDSLKRQREEIENDARIQEELNRRVPQPPPTHGFFGNQQMPRPREDIEESMMNRNDSFANEEPQKPFPPDPRFLRGVKTLNVKFSIFLENGQKLPIAFQCPEDKIDQVMETIDQKIIDGEMIAIGDFKFPGSKVLYIDLQGR